MDKKIAKVVIDIPHPTLDRTFDYIVPEEYQDSIFAGVKVEVPFGIANRLTDGYVWSLTDTSEWPEARLKAIASVGNEDLVLPDKFIPVVEWMRHEYHCTYIDAIRCFVPPYAQKIRSSKYTYTIKLTADEKTVSDFIKNNAKRSPVMCKVLMLLMDCEEMAKDDICLNTSATQQTFTSLKARGLIEIYKEERFRDVESEIKPYTKKITLTEQQKICIDTAKAMLNAENKKPILIRGVTGSGKTEVYMNITEYALSCGKNVIMLIPEISLTPQTVANFRGRFGNSIAILNSRLSNGERYDEWRRIRSGQAKVVIGARSAVFAPVCKLGAIIIDEEHEDSYKSENSPRYNAFDIAAIRCKNENALLVLGSATPDVVHYYQANNGEFVKLLMEQRVGVGFPDIHICDMRREIEMGNRTMFGRPLAERLSKILKSDEQGILLLNRRGFAEHVSCRSCGFVYKCKHCNVSLTYHKQHNILKCHYCGYAQYMDTVCPVCGSKYIKVFGRGTQKLEEEIDKLFPGMTVLRMDADTTSTKGAHHRMLKAFGEKRYKLLVGTQMVAKGLDFENVTLVGLIAPDLTLNMPEYKSAERVFRLISQASGRAGRGQKHGDVIIQSYEPEHYAVTTAAANDYEQFYERELAVRQQMNYPPFCRILRLLFTSANENAAQTEAKNAADTIKHEMKDFANTEVMVSPAPIERMHDRFRWHIVVKYNRNSNEAHEQLHHAVNIILDENEFAAVRISVDFSPASLM